METPDHLSGSKKLGKWVFLPFSLFLFPLIYSFSLSLWPRLPTPLPCITGQLYTFAAVDGNQELSRDSIAGICYFVGSFLSSTLSHPFTSSILTP